jgi:hypothetical protein
MTMNEKVSQNGMFAALGIALMATLGHVVTAERTFNRFDMLWLSMFVLSIFVLSGAAVNFDPKRWLK